MAKIEDKFTDWDQYYREECEKIIKKTQSMSIIELLWKWDKKLIHEIKIERGALEKWISGSTAQCNIDINIEDYKDLKESEIREMLVKRIGRKDFENMIKATYHTLPLCPDKMFLFNEPFNWGTSYYLIIVSYNDFSWRYLFE